tara:strand:+ start:6837 stop:6947 length:111 start_codon:yes stop_codon:yes gene_type:complete
MKGKEGGDTWEKRKEFLEGVGSEAHTSWGADFHGLD